MSAVLIKSFCAPEPDFLEASRYAGAFSHPKTLQLLKSVYQKLKDDLEYKVCYAEYPIKIENDDVCLGGFHFRSHELKKCLSGCKNALVFGATLGIGIDRYINKSGKISPSQSLLADALGSEQIEALCDTFCCSFENERGVSLKPRFSPGYGDLLLSAQQDIFFLLNCPKNIGLCLSDSFIMTPSKSVTAIVGIEEKPNKSKKTKCDACKNISCEYRR